MHIPTKEVHFPQEVCYPFAEARRIAIETMTKLAPPGLPTDLPPLALPFAEEAGEVEDEREQQRKVPQLSNPRPPKQKGFMITFKRMCDLGTTDGCAACKVFSKTMTRSRACRERFRKVLKINESTAAEDVASIA